MIMKMPLDGYVERDVKFGGVLRDLPITLDPTDRAQMLKVIDHGKSVQSDRVIGWTGRSDLKACLFLSIHNIKLCSRVDTEDLLLRIPISQIAAVSYIDDHDAHILAITFGELDIQKQQRRRSDTDTVCSCNLAVVYCESRAQSEEICSLVDQCFQIVYTDATMHYFDHSLREGARQSSGLDPAIYGADKSVRGKSGLTLNSLRRTSDEDLPGFLSHSSISVSSGSSSSGPVVGAITAVTHHSSSEAMSSSSNRSRSPSDESQRVSSGGAAVGSGQKLSGEGGRVEELSEAARKLIFNYMNKLYNKLTPSELQKFSVLVKAWHTDMTFSQFCDGVAELYGPDRKYLLVEMRPFIPAKDSAYFERFIENIEQRRLSDPTANNVFAAADRSILRTSSPVGITRFGPGHPTSSAMVTQQKYDDNVCDDEYDVVLDDISRGIDRLRRDNSGPPF